MMNYPELSSISAQIPNICLAQFSCGANLPMKRKRFS